MLECTVLFIMLSCTVLYSPGWFCVPDHFLFLHPLRVYLFYSFTDLTRFHHFLALNNFIAYFLECGVRCVSRYQDGNCQASNATIHIMMNIPSVRLFWSVIDHLGRHGIFLTGFSSITNDSLCNGQLSIY